MQDHNPPLIFDHVGIVTADIEAAARAVGDTFGASGFTARFDDDVLGVSVLFVRDRSGVVYELIEPFGDNSPVAKTLVSKTNLLNQVAYRTRSLAHSVAALRRTGALPLGPPRAAKAFAGANVQFLLSELGFIIELIEAESFEHDFRASLDLQAELTGRNGPQGA